MSVDLNGLMGFGFGFQDLGIAPEFGLDIGFYGTVQPNFDLILLC